MLGTDIRNCQSVEEAIVKANLNWHIREEAVITASGSQTRKKALIKATDNTVLGVVSKRYRPIGNYSLFTFVDNLLAEGKITLDSAGEINKGKKIFINCKVAEDEISKGDKICRQLFIMNSFDGGSSLSLKFHNKRLVCSNQLSSLYSGSLRLKHSTGIHEKLTELEKAIDVSNQVFHREVREYQQMQNTLISLDTYKAYLENVFKLHYTEIKDAEKLEYLFFNGKGNNGDTLYDAYNSVTEYLTHNRGKSEETRFISNLSGNNFKIASRALEVALQW